MFTLGWSSTSELELMLKLMLKSIGMRQKQGEVEDGQVSKLSC